MYLAVEFEYGFEWKNLSDEDWLALRGAIPTLPNDKPTYYPSGTFIITHDAMPLLAKHKITFRLSQDETSQGIGSMLVKLQDRINALEMKGATLGELALKGAAVQIAIPDFALLMIDEVTYLTDACTESLQKYLDEGWRILAVCPPNAQRRPDYILGKRKCK